MIEFLAFFNPHLSSFGMASWLVCFLTALYIFYVAAENPSVWIKPSFIVVVFLNLQTQWGSAWNIEWIEMYLINPWPYFAMVQLFPLVLIFCIPHFWREPTKLAYARLFESSTNAVPKKGLLFLSLVAVGLVLWYFANLPFSETGLHALLFHPLDATQARERSFKLLDSRTLRYAYSIFKTAIAPVFAVALVSKLRSKFSIGNLLLFCFFITFLLIAVSFSGARSPAAFILLTIFFAFFLVSQKKVNISRLCLATFLVLLIPSLLAMASGGTDWSLSSFYVYFTNMIDRAFGRNIVDSVWHVAYVESNGPAGIAAIENLAPLLGLKPINLFNIVSTLHRGIDLPTGLASTTFVVAYYSVFGGIAFILSLALILLLDGIVVFYKNIDLEYLLPCIASMQIAATNLTATYFTTALVSFGLLTIPLLSWFLGFLDSKNLRLFPR